MWFWRAIIDITLKKIMMQIGLGLTDTEYSVEFNARAIHDHS